MQQTRQKQDFSLSLLAVSQCACDPLFYQSNIYMLGDIYSSLIAYRGLWDLFDQRITVSCFSIDFQYFPQIVVPLW